jgi:hypothetical protein
MSAKSWILTVGMLQKLDLGREYGPKPWTSAMNLEYLIKYEINGHNSFTYDDP